MKAWVLDAPHTELHLEEREIPTPGPGQVVIKTRATGLCHSDVGYIEGVIPFQRELPIVLGHEASGTIHSLGDGVTGWAVGEAVVATGNGADSPGVTHDGAYAEYFVATAARLVRLPDGTDWGQAAAATDAGLTSYTGVVVHGGVKAGDRVGIVGLGGLGLTAARIAVITGAEVYAVEPRETVWQAAKDRGVTEVYKDVAELAGLELDVIVDFAGFGTTTTGAIDAVKYGGRVALVGLGKTNWEFNSYALVSRAITLQGSTPQGEPKHLQAVIDMVASGDLVIQASEIAFDEIPEGLKRLERGEVSGRLYASLPA